MATNISRSGFCHTIIIDLLNTVNKYRANHGVPPLTYRKDLEESAQKAVTTFARIENASFRETEYVDYGECLNRVNCGNHNITGEELAAVWYIEGDGYNFASRPTKTAKNFTQMIWAASSDVGFAIKVNDKNDVYFVGHFYPRGNVPDYYLFNVMPLKIGTPLFESRFEMNLISVRRMNFYRLKHGCAPIELCLDLIKTAQDQAVLLAKADRSTNIRPTCNVWESSLTYFDPMEKLKYKLIIDDWYNLGKKVDYTNFHIGSDTDCFTQMIWKGTKYAGFGASYHRGYHAFVVHFMPRGDPYANYTNYIKEQQHLPQTIHESTFYRYRVVNIGFLL